MSSGAKRLPGSRRIMPASCEVCDGVLEHDELCRELVAVGGAVSVYGHARCIDALVAELVARGGVYAGDVAP